MIHIVREVVKPDSRLHKKEVVEEIMIIDCPKMVIVGVIDYIEISRGLKVVKTLFGEYSNECAIRRGKNHFISFNKYQKKETQTKNFKEI